ncbi:SIR2 family protein [Poseidonibacter lekithochrous]|uniref:SIR2 family protein n=1 Tax=Poseidonibacter TaxID=2321187 RepID=UPI001C093692|nr:MULTISPECIES: SIR2 family protein [Poseidonibacter]MBU3014631.1 SIR2 family protein [Poseidonibacter lekithochrous]MDO6827929.1 SIR2 family protein [Poseidonibacter sp. 1_MG-2023]
MNKIVYVLGAGFSIPYGIPAQKDIMKHCFEDADFLKEMKKFYKEFYLFSSKKLTKPALSKIPLEDVFSLLDRSIKSAHKYKDLTVSDFINKENILTNKIADYFESIEKDNTYISEFIDKLIKFRKESGKEDNQSIITLNWDNLIDKYIQNKIVDDTVGLDYCMFDYSFEEQFQENKNHVPSTHLKVKGINNIKLIKLHGSINWNICHSCHKVYINKKKISNEFKCKSCNVNLEKFMISPTFMKEFQTNHIKNIWQNAFIDLSEAKHIVFVGYSFPLADFEFKILLSRALKKESDIKITVVDYKNQDTSKSTVFKELRERYESFFGTNVEFSDKGIVNYIEEKMDNDLKGIYNEF